LRQKWVTIKINNPQIMNISSKINRKIRFVLSNKSSEQLEKILDLNQIHLEENEGVNK